ncbi:MAG: hypothetical protein IPL22_18970 [Bacteroidetes bacterium]|nr:hypothetical protein [Bacteroidota bacterium]
MKKIAEDIVKHFPRRGYKGRGMIISIDRYTAMKMYDLVKQYWADEIKELRKSKWSLKRMKKKPHEETIKYMNWVEMAVVISYDKSDEEKLAFEKRGVDITPHIRKMETLDENGHDLEFPFSGITQTLFNWFCE